MVGKTRLATEIAVQAQFGGARLLKGQCFENGGLPYMPVAQMIRSTFESDFAPTLPTAVLDDLQRVAPDIKRTNFWPASIFTPACAYVGADDGSVTVNYRGGPCRGNQKKSGAESRARAEPDGAFGSESTAS